MKYFRALSERKRALHASRAARADFEQATDALIGAWQAHPLPALACAAGAGFVLARLRAGSGIMRAAIRIASGPGWRLVRQYLVL